MTATDGESLPEFILARIAEVELMAHDATGRYAAEGVETGDHWRWESEADDRPIDLGATVRFADVDYADYEGSAGLRSEEEYTTNVCPLPAFALSGVEELRIGPARHIAYWDPARVLAECEAKRRIVELHVVEPLPPPSKSASCVQCWGAVWPCPTLRLLASPHRDHPDYRPEWAPEQ